MTGITLLGLGPGDPKYLTREALQWLESLSEIYHDVPQHPVLTTIPTKVKQIVIDTSGVAGNIDEDQLQNMVDRIMTLGARPEGVTFATAGHPCRDSIIGWEVFTQALKKGNRLRVISGLSWGELIYQLTGIPTPSQLMSINTLDLIRCQMPYFPPSQAVIIAPVGSQTTIASLKKILLRVYPPEHPLILIRAGSLKPEMEKLTMATLQKCKILSEFTSLYVLPLSKNTSFESFQEIVAKLRAPGGCPWDREQTHLSLRQHLLEESYETLEAIDSGNPDELCEELGDLLLQIVLNAQIASEKQTFNMNQVIRGISSKIISRHPHVFGEVKINGVGGVLRNWEKLKEAERQQNGKHDKGLLAGAPNSLPALAYSHEIQDRAARVGFDWPGIEGVIDKVREELEEVLSAKTDAERENEIGDLAFAVVNLARWLKVDPESALRGSNQRFKQRFKHIEETAHKKGIALADLGFEEMDRLWEEAKDKRK